MFPQSSIQYWWVIWFNEYDLYFSKKKTIIANTKLFRINFYTLISAVRQDVEAWGKIINGMRCTTWPSNNIPIIVILKEIISIIWRRRCMVHCLNWICPLTVECLFFNLTITNDTTSLFYLLGWLHLHGSYTNWITTNTSMNNIDSTETWIKSIQIILCGTNNMNFLAN